MVTSGNPPPRQTYRLWRWEYLDAGREASACIEQLRRGEATRVYFSPISADVEEHIKSAFKTDELQWGRIDDVCTTVERVQDMTSRG